MMSDGLARAVLDALPDATAVLDSAGTIVDVNRAWLMFALDNGGQPESTGVGVNYLDLCARSAAAGCTDARILRCLARTSTAWIRCLRRSCPRCAR